MNKAYVSDRVQCLMKWLHKAFTLLYQSTVTEKNVYTAVTIAICVQEGREVEKERSRLSGKRSCKHSH